MNNNEYQIDRALEANDETLAAVRNLLAQLSTKEHPIDMELLSRILDSECTLLYLLRHIPTGEIVGMITLGTYSLLTGQKWWVEDVVIDNAHRGKGLGHTLLQHVRREVAKLGGGSLLLTSRPSRVAANHLYQSEGYQRRETNVYKLEVPAE